jgi:hypothetical protein
VSALARQPSGYPQASAVSPAFRSMFSGIRNREMVV